MHTVKNGVLEYTPYRVFMNTHPPKGVYETTYVSRGVTIKLTQGVLSIYLLFRVLQILHRSVVQLPLNIYIKITCNGNRLSWKLPL